MKKLNFSKFTAAVIFIIGIAALIYARRKNSIEEYYAQREDYLE